VHPCHQRIGRNARPRPRAGNVHVFLDLAIVKVEPMYAKIH